MKITKYTVLVGIISFILFVIPFFWFKPGEMDLGGDSSRLYFYDPIAYLKNYAFYGVSPSGFGQENIGYFMVPFLLLLSFFKFLIGSPTTLIALFNGINVSIAFLACYAIVKELIDTKEKKLINAFEFSAIIAGLFYVFSQLAINSWDKALYTHNQFFLNPLMFLLLLRYFKNSKFFYLLIFLILTFIFSPNFSFAAAPSFFAFYPVSIAFLILYRIYILGKKIIWKDALIAVCLFLLLQAFHIIPQLVSLFSPGSVLNTTVFSDAGKFDRGLSYFISIAPNIKVSLSIMNLQQMTQLHFIDYLFIIFPLIITFGFMYNKNKTLTLAGVFFLIVLFFATANITNIGFEIYKKLFDIPGFSMFRNFFGQWGYALLFFSTILFGQALYVVLMKIKERYRYLLCAILLLLLFVNAFPFINGFLVNKVIWQSNNIHVFMKMDPQYEKLLRYVRTLPADGKILIFPLTDPGYQIVSGANGGAYQGPSTISYLTGKQDFSGIQELGMFQNIFLDLVKKKDYEKINQLLGQLNIKYVFYNADPLVYEKGFPSFPYIDARKSLPKTQKEYREFISKLSLRQLTEIDKKYFVYEVGDTYYTQLFFPDNKAQYYANEISNWSVPLSFNQPGDQTVFEASQVPPVADTSFVELSKNNIFRNVLKNPDPPVYLHNAFAKTEPYSLLYKPSVIKEYITLQRHKDSFNYIDQRMFLSAKLLYALELWGQDMPLGYEKYNINEISRTLLATDDQRTLEWELSHANNSWESFLSRYVRNFTESIDYIENSSEDKKWKEQQKFLIYAYILNHKPRFINTIEGFGQSNEKGIVLEKVINKIFETLIARLDLPSLKESQNEYSIPASNTTTQARSLYMNRNDYKQFSPENFTLTIGEKELFPDSVQDEESWIKYDTSGIDLSKEAALEIITKKPKDLMEKADFISISPFTNNVKEATSLEWRNGLFWKTKEWQPSSYYVLSFEYINNSTPFSLRFYEEDAVSNTKDTKILFIDHLNSKVWTKYQAVIRSDKDADAAFVQIGGDTVESPASALKIKNISLVYIPQPNIVLKEDNTAPSDIHTPTISFIKINSTKYKITVTNSHGPFYLVFNQLFNSRWKLFAASNSLRENGNGFDKHFLETFNEKPLFESSHHFVNGNENAWYIDPKELGNKTSYSFILEMTTQRYFYIGLIISVTVFIGLLFYSIYRLFRHEK